MQQPGPSLPFQRDDRGNHFLFDGDIFRLLYFHNHPHGPPRAFPTSHRRLLLRAPPPPPQVFTSKEELDARTAKYEEQVWTSSYDPKYVRTLEDALKYDERCRALAASFPASHRDAVLRLFHHCTAVSLDKLADVVYEKTRPAEPPSPVKAAAPPPEENGGEEWLGGGLAGRGKSRVLYCALG